MEEIVVTATRGEKTIASIPKNVTIITSQDIEQSTAGNIVDLLGREANLNLRSTTGNEGKSGVDIRGMGDAYVSNVIVMVDGFKLNASDMSGADFLSVPLGQVERIEIVRGAGSVLYGNGAVGGVINIITKKPGAGLSAKALITAGSFKTYGGRFQIGTKKDRLALSLAGGYADSEGYRDNGGLRKKDAVINLGYDIFDTSTVEFNISLLESNIGLPGPVAQEDVDDRNKRRETSAPNDFSSTVDNRYTGKIDFETSVGLFTFKGGYRDRENSYIIGYSPIISEADQTDKILEDTLQSSLVHEHTYSVAGLENTSVMGVDFYDTQYLRENAWAEKKNGDTQTIEGFIHDELVLTSQLSLSGGYRYSRFSGTFQDENYTDFFSPPVLPPPVFIPPQYLYSVWIPEQVREKEWTNQAYEFGIAWEAAEPLTLFASHATSYRIPNVDEFALSDNDLHPQKSRHYDAGVRLKMEYIAELSLTLFDMTTTDEIYYGEDPDTGTSVNRNYDEKTQRRGVETQIKIYPSDWLYIWGNYSYTQAKFELSDTFIPLVPEHLGNIGIEWYLFDSLTLALTGTMASSRYDGNDQANTADDQMLGSYKVFDTKVTWQKENFRLFAGIKNIFDELYVTSAYSGSSYPMPTQSFFFGVEWTY